MPPALAMLCLVAAMAFGGANLPIGKAIVAEVPVDAFLVVRFVAASALLAVLVPFEPGPRLTALSARQWLGLCALAMLGSVLFTTFLLMGLARTSAIDAGIITASLPAVVVAAGAILGARPRAGDLVMVTLAVAGVVLVQATVDGGIGSSLIGNLLIGLAVVCEASFVLISRGMSRVLRPVRLSFGVALASLVACLPLLVVGVGGFDVVAVSPRTWLLMGWYSLAASVLATVLWYHGAAHVPPWSAGLATAALPVSALVVSAAWLGETVTASQFAGAALVVLAIVAGTLSQRR